MKRLVWFRSDLRIHDNAALFHACTQGLDNIDDALIAIVFITQQQWHTHGLGSRKIQLIKNSISELSDSLTAIGIPLLILEADTFGDCENQLREIIKSLSIDEVFFNIEYEVNERKRDISLSRWCKEKDVHVYKYHDQCVVPPGQVTTRQDLPFKVFSPFKKSWIQAFGQFKSSPLGAPERLAKEKEEINKTLVKGLISRKEFRIIDSSEIYQKDTLWPVSEEYAHQQLNTFLNNRAHHYHQERDLPSLDSTSRLSAYLSLGILSPRQCLYTTWQLNACVLAGGQPGLDSWINELIWREFYRHLLVAFPYLCKHKNFKEESNQVPWRNSQQDFDAWCQGKTGYPIVDAAMKQLLETGWMHNRLRMIAAMFLTKHLLIDWRQGEAFFNQYLVDADLASNNGGWQWSASTGADGVPYFRIFNPTTQSRRFDPDALLLSRYLPELSNIPVIDRHQPTVQQRQSIGYPEEIIDHRIARQRALHAFKYNELIETEPDDTHQVGLFG